MTTENNQQQQQQAAPWYGSDAETKGYLENRGLLDKKPEEVALLSIKAHREAEKHLGAPASELVRLPKATDGKDAWKPVWERLGAPADGKYDFAAVKTAKGEAIDAKLAETIAGTASALMLPKDHATAFATAIVRHNEAAEASKTVEASAKLAEETATLDKDWGANKAAHMIVAKNAVARLGVEPEAVAALEGKVGYAKVMQMFQKIGAALGEDKYIRNENDATGKGPMTVEAAKEKKSQLMSDNAWVNKYQQGDREAFAEMLTLNKIITGNA